MTRPGYRIVHESKHENFFDGATTDKLITLEQERKAPFTFMLTYGLEVKSGLTYEQACMALGSAILHFECIEGRAVNTGK